ncbi:hypothetical protein TPHA_0G00890 [Tetrapisispora phaffii CBS 4417]|uniref:Prenyltransferase alpha-alpha toroid domain-containing protein n=1 Tax=Tetrapisispora phaffii (strain ATCC 24235 / CBS 4417 / NBRC 1672 / NRRL Y-8282 / UCD 70-5) TaxID=1071381 RepID=G8BVJ7_TETPH|nr:hypothetical protein TPHA_0G00890 [Tetrapisispora phaffii CBS 4417]CCE63925.1 hypothetical protein TPHA_0G00890 [Tetrapisispora phaffii CBS 4417]
MVETKKHVKFLQRHLLLLPPKAQSQDPNKLGIVYYAIAGLALLDESALSAYTKNKDWIYKHYKEFDPPSNSKRIAGFIGSQLLSLDGQVTINLSNTLFALIILNIIDDCDGRSKNINYEHIRNFVSQCQVPNGQFVSSLDSFTGLPSRVDSTDLRYCYIAVAILYFTGCRTRANFDKHIHVESLLAFVKSQECMNGGYGEYLEAHAGYTSCALSLLKLLGCEAELTESFRWHTITWLLDRQVSNTGCMSLQEDNQNYEQDDHGGFQGRENKFADTCYVFWCLNSLKILSPDNWKSLCEINIAKEFLMDKTQDKLLGGFSKTDVDDPDIYHTYLGLASLGLLDGSLNGELCIPTKYQPR